MDREDPQAPRLVVWCTPGGGGLHVPAPLEHSYCTLEGQLEVGLARVEVEQTTCVYQGNHNTLPTLLDHMMDEHISYGAEYQTAGSADNGPFSSVHNHNVPCAVCYTPTRGTVVMIPARLTCPSSWTREYHGYLMANHHSYHRTLYECVDQSPQSVPGSLSDTNGALFYHTEVRCHHGVPCPPYNAQKEVTCVVCTK